MTVLHFLIAQCLRMQIVFHLSTMIETGRQYLPNELLVLLCRLLAQTPYRKLSVNNLKNINKGTCLIQQKIVRADSLMKKIADS